MTTAFIGPSGIVEYGPDIEGLTLRHPVDGEPNISQAFGVVSVTGIKHRGIDFVQSYATPIKAMRDGTVYFTRTGSWPHYGGFPPGYIGVDTSWGGYGNQVIVQHDKGYSMYAHMVTLAVSQGQAVKAGDVLGYLDSTGISTGNHTHVEFRLTDNVTRIDFWKYIGADAPTPPPPPDPDEEWYMALTDAQKVSLARLADLDIAGLTFAPGVPGRSLLIRMMDAYKGLSDDERLKFDRRFDRLIKQLGGKVTTDEQGAITLARWLYGLSLPEGNA